MEKQKKGKALKVVLICLAALVICCAAVMIYWHEAAYAVFKNVTVKKYDLPETDSWDGGETLLKVPYASDSDSQYLDLYIPETSGDEKPQLFVLIHGGGFITNDSQSRQVRLMYRYFRDHGYACASINYRLAPEEPFPGALSDCKAAIRFLRANAEKYGYNADRIPVFGESAGGYLCTLTSLTGDDEFNDVKFIGEEEAGEFSSSVDVVVDYYGHIDNRGSEEDFAKLRIPAFIRRIANSWVSGDAAGGYEDVESYWFRKNVSEMSDEEFELRDPHAYIDKKDLSGMSFWILHGDCDITVPYLQSERLNDHLLDYVPAENIHYEIAPGMGHASDPLYSDGHLAELDQFLKEKLSD